MANTLSPEVDTAWTEARVVADAIQELTEGQSMLHQSAAAEVYRDGITRVTHAIGLVAVIGLPAAYAISRSL